MKGEFCHGSKIPTLDSNTPWEQIVEFRSDADVKRKYYALINWVNEISDSDMTLSHLADKYNQLYTEYLNQYRLHKLTSDLSTVELLFLQSMDVIASILDQNYLTAFKQLINIRKQQVSLIKAEKEIQGRELAYIFSVNEKFKV